MILHRSSNDKNLGLNSPIPHPPLAIGEGKNWSQYLMLGLLNLHSQMINMIVYCQFWNHDVLGATIPLPLSFIV